MKQNRKHQDRPTLREMSFDQLVAAVPELADARREYAGKSAKERRAAAEWAYDAGMANDLFSKALSLNENDPRVLNDLGWTLVLAGFYYEARTVLERAAAIAPAEYDLLRNNLKELEKRVSNTHAPGLRRKQ